MGIAISFGFPRLPAKPNRHSFLRLRVLREAQLQFIFASPDTPGSKIVIPFCVSGHSGKPNRNSFWASGDSGKRNRNSFWPSGDSGKRNRNSFLAFRGLRNANRNSFLAYRGLGNANRNSFLASRSLGNANRNSFFASLSLRRAKSQFILGFMDTPSMLIEDYFMLH